MTLVGARGGSCDNAASRKGDCGNSLGSVERESRGERENEKVRVFEIIEKKKRGGLENRLFPFHTD